MEPQIMIGGSEMEQNIISAERLTAFGNWLKTTDHAHGTVAKYLRDVHAFMRWLNGGTISKERVLAWRENLLGRYRPVTINAMLAALNSFFALRVGIPLKYLF